MDSSQTKNNPSGKIVLFNLTGLPQNWCYQIKHHLIPDLKPLVLLINETKLAEKGERNINDILELENLGYRQISKFKPNNSIAGGISFIYRDNISAENIPLPQQIQHLQAIVCKIKGSYILEYTICNYYNSPSEQINISSNKDHIFSLPL